MEDRSSQVLVTAISFMILCWVTVSLRVYCRAWVIRAFGSDDRLLMFLQCIYTAYLTCQLMGWRHGTGQHKAVLSQDDNKHALMWWFFCELLYIICTTLLKVAVGLFLLRVALGSIHIWILRVLILGTVLFGMTYLFMVAFQCSPPSSFWDESPRALGKCWSTTIVLTLTYMMSAINCIADWSFGLLPMFIVQTLSMPRRTKILVACILGFASMWVMSGLALGVSMNSHTHVDNRGSTATVARMFYVPKLLNGEDFLYATTDVAIWSTVEVGIGIAALSIAALRPLWQTWCYQLGLAPVEPHNRAWVSRHRADCQLRSYQRARRHDSSRLHRLRGDGLTSLSKLPIPVSAVSSSGQNHHQSTYQPITVSHETRSPERR